MMILKERIALFKDMVCQIKTLEDEIPYEEWICAVPDEADDEDFLEIAEDLENFHSVCVLFCKLMTKYCF